MMTASLVTDVATILGGLAAVAFFYEVFNRHRAKVMVARLDGACRYIITTRRKIERAAIAQPPTRLAPFASPPDTPGSYGPLTNPAARAAFLQLQELGVIVPIPGDTSRGTTEYRWTRLGRRVARKLSN